MLKGRIFILLKKMKNIMKIEIKYDKYIRNSFFFF